MKCPINILQCSEWLFRSSRKTSSTQTYCTVPPLARIVVSRSVTLLKRSCHIVSFANHPQLAMVAAFAVSAHATQVFRVAKPFDALLGETYECDRSDDLGWRCFSEQGG